MALVSGVLQAAHSTGAPVTINLVAAQVPETHGHAHHEHHGFLAHLRSKEGIGLLTAVLTLFGGGLSLGTAVAETQQEPAKPTVPSPAVVLVREVRPGEIDAHLPSDLDQHTPQHTPDPEALSRFVDSVRGVLSELDEQQLRAYAELVGVQWTHDRDELITDLVGPVARQLMRDDWF